jgi:hypothetical protein
MDDEDKNNKNHTWGYTGAIVNDKNTRFSFCRLDGRQLNVDFASRDPQWPRTMCERHLVKKLRARLQFGSTQRDTKTHAPLSPRMKFG